MHRRHMAMRARASRVASVYDQTRGQRRAVVGDVGFVRHFVHASAVVVRASDRRWGERGHHAGAPQGGKRRDRGHMHLRVGGGDGCVRRAVEAQRRRRRLAAARVAHCRRQGEIRPNHRAAVAHSWRPNLKIGGILRRRPWHDRHLVAAAAD